MATKKITYKGKSFSSVAALARHLGLKADTLRIRIRKGLHEEEWAEPARLSQHTNKTLDAEIKTRGLGVKRIDDVIDTKTPISFLCLAHLKVHPAAPSNILHGYGLECCRLAAVRRNARAKIAKSAAEYDNRLKEMKSPLVRLGDYVNNDTPIWHLCTKHWEWRRTTPHSALGGRGLKCCLVASNTRRTHERRDKSGEQYIEYLKTYENGNFELLGKYIGRDYPVDHYCNRHNRTLPARPSGLLGGQKMKCCWDAFVAEQGRERMRAASADFVERLAKANPDVELVGEYLGTNAKTLFRCNKHNQVHPGAPKARLRGIGLHCCNVDNGRRMGRLTGPLNGWGGDSVWKVLCGRSQRHEPSILYLFDSPDTRLLKYGITSGTPEQRKRRSWHPGVKAIRYGDLLISPREYTHRDQAVLIEGAYQFSYGYDADSDLGIGWSELTDANPEEFLERIEDLEVALLEMGPWDFAQEYCDPAQIDKAKKLMGARIH